MPNSSPRFASSSGVLSPKQYAVGLSFQQRDRQFANRVAKCLERKFGRHRVFYDQWQDKEFKGIDGTEQIKAIYRDRCELLIPFFSANYKQECFCFDVEWPVIKELIQVNPGVDVAIPVRRDVTEIEGWPKTAFAIRAIRKSADKVAQEIIEFYEARVRDQSRIENPMSQGFILVADISNFSAIPSSQFQRVIDALWRTPIEIGLFSDKYFCKMSGLLDGLIVTVTNITHATLLRLCEKWIKRLEQNTFGEFGHEGVQLRIAIHRGAYYWIPERSLIVGTPANVCSRLVRMAGPGQIVLSEDFISSWREDEGDDALLDIEPPLDKKPMGFSLVPGKISRFRIHPFNAGKRPSECLQQIHAVEEAIKQLLAEIEDDLIAAIAEEGCSIPRRTVHARVSLFVADKVNRPVARMVCTEIRHLRYKDASISGNESVTTYSIADRNRPHGPVGRAYVSRKVQVVSGLPPYSKQPKEYIKVMTKAPWNVPEETVRRFGRKARCFISIPFSLQADAETPEGVICIDTKDPLSHVPLENLRDHCEAIGNLYGPILAALLRLR